MNDDDFDTASVHNVHDIQEEEPRLHGGRWAPWIMASLGAGCIIACALALVKPSASTQGAAQSDPLGDLLQKSRDQPAPTTKPIHVADVTFPSTLSDRKNPTTAMEAIRHGGGSIELPSDLPYDGPPAAADSLPVIPLPAQDILVPGRPTVARGDHLRTMAQHASREQKGGVMAEQGHAGGYQLQVASFKKNVEADTFAGALRRRGHRAHVEQANVPGRGLWFRVKIGPFKYKRSADIYRQDFEAKERMVTFVVKPSRTKVTIKLQEDPSDKKAKVEPKSDSKMKVTVH